MTIEDMAVMDRIERLAFMAGQRMAGIQVAPEPKPIKEPEPKIPTELVPVFKTIKAFLKDYPASSGVCYSSIDGTNNLTWEDLREIAKFA